MKMLKIIWKVIWKNFKLLMRSKLSAFVILFGPLMVILLVGLSFSTNTSYNLNLGVYSKSYSEMTNSFLHKLNSNNYMVMKYKSEKECVDGIKYGQINACVIFPENLSVEDNKKNPVKVFIDQSKINLAYLVINTISSSFSNRSNEISMNLTNNILDVTFQNRDTIAGIKDALPKVVEDNRKIREISIEAASEINSMDLTFQSNSSSMNEPLLKLRGQIEMAQTDMVRLLGQANSAISDLEDTSLDGNQTEYISDVKAKLGEINTTFTNFHDQSMTRVVDSISAFDNTIKDMTGKLSAAQNKNAVVIAKLNEISQETEAIETDMADINQQMESMLSRIGGIQVTQADSIVNPISTQIFPIAKEKNTLSFMFPTLVVLLLMFTSLLLPALLIIIEKNSRAYFRIFMTPVSDILFTFTTYISSLALLFVQLIVILLVSQFYFKLGLGEILPKISLILFVVSTFFILMGMLIGYLFKTEEMATLAAVSIGSILLLTSGLIFPLESMPRSIISIAQYNPLLMSAEIFKKLLLFGADFSALQTGLRTISIYSLVVLAIVVLQQKISKVRILHPRIKKAASNYFVVNGKPAATLPEFIVSIKEMHDSVFSEVVDKRAIPKWLEAAGNKKLAEETSALVTKDAILSVLVRDVK